jgi:hypothetical protein
MAAQEILRDRCPEMPRRFMTASETDSRDRDEDEQIPLYELTRPRVREDAWKDFHGPSYMHDSKN